MRHLSTLLCAAVTMCVAVGAQAALPARYGSYNPAERSWHKAASSARLAQTTRDAVTAGQAVTDPAESYGQLLLPDGTAWYYTSNFTYSPTFSIEAVDVTVYDETSAKVGSFAFPLTLEGNETGINYVEINPYVTRKFFNYDDRYEFMVYVHATTTDYVGHSYTIVCQFDATEPMMRIEGNQVALINTATDSYGETYTMVFERETILSDGSYGYCFDVYRKASYSTVNHLAELAHTFEVAFNLIEGPEYFLPVLLTKHANAPMYALPHYAKPYFVPSDSWNVEPDVTPDNSFVIDLYDSNFELVKSTVIPIEPVEGYLYTMPMLGDLGYTDDISWGRYTSGSEYPDYVVSVANYLHSIDSFVTDYVVYDADGHKIMTIAEGVHDRLRLSSLPGCPDEYCFVRIDDEGAYIYDFVNPLTGVVSASIPAEFEDNTLTTSLDRALLRGVPYYVFSFGLGEYTDDDPDMVLHKFAWFNTDGTLSHIDAVPVGHGIIMVNPYVAASVLDPFFFTTRGTMAYMMFVKYTPNNGRTIEEQLRIIDVEGNVLLQFTPRPGGNNLTLVSLINASTKPALLVTYVNDEWEYFTEYVALPLDLFAMGGDGSEASPYLISTVGDLRQMSHNTEAYYRLANDIDATGYIHPCVRGNFTGRLDGDGHAISLMTIEGALFEYITEGSAVTNLVLDRPTLLPTDRDAYVGFIAGMSSGGDKAPAITDVTVISPRFDDDNYVGTVGGIIGRATTNTIISNCRVIDADINAPRAELGGIAGNVLTGTDISLVYVSGKLCGDIVGGVAATTSNGDERIYDCHVNTSITGVSNVGGIIGESARSRVVHCLVEGDLTATSKVDPSVGGLVGHLEESFDDASTALVINNNIVAVTAINYDKDAAKATAHRVVGHVSDDDPGAIDWESDYWLGDVSDDPNDWPRLPGTHEKGLANNYVVGLAAISSEMPTTATSPEGADAEAVDGTLAANLKFAVGTKWMDEPLRLAIEDLPSAWLSVNAENIVIEKGDGATIVFTLIGGDINDVNITSTDYSIVLLDEVERDGLTAIVTIECIAVGEAEIIAEYDGVVAKCSISSLSGVESVISDTACGITYDGRRVLSQGACISIYAVDGALVAHGRDAVSTEALAPGIYVAHATSADGSSALKIRVD